MQTICMQTTSNEPVRKLRNCRQLTKLGEDNSLLKAYSIKMTFSDFFFNYKLKYFVQSTM